ncbi:MAG: endonuclease MutS2, partial [Bacteroidetes bacterium]|nr:endonuclease MutS2 [Bacteroidota bacterium]
MGLYPKHFEQKIGFENIRISLKGLCISSLGEAFVDKICFLNNFNNISKLLIQVEEFKKILLSEDNFPTDHYYDITSELNKVIVAGAFLETDVLFDLKRSLNTISEIIIYFKKNEEALYPLLKKLSSSVFLDKSIINQLKIILDDKGKIRDSASPVLLQIRQELISKHSTVAKRIAQVMNNARKQGWVPDNMEVSIRNGRMVIPVLAAYKRSIKGFIHDESATGQTIFIEPADVFEMNNDIRELENAEKREIQKI